MGFSLSNSSLIPFRTTPYSCCPLSIFSTFVFPFRDVELGYTDLTDRATYIKGDPYIRDMKNTA